MFDRVGRLAGQTAVSLSRRKLLIRMGQGALSVAALPALTGVATAAGECRFEGCCGVGGCCPAGTYLWVSGGRPTMCYEDKHCKKFFGNCLGV